MTQLLVEEAAYAALELSEALLDSRAAEEQATGERLTEMATRQLRGGR